MDLFNAIASRLSVFPLAWSLLIVAMGYIVIVMRRSDQIQESRLQDFKDMLAKYQELLDSFKGK